VIVTCQDARINPYESLGIKLGTTHIVRNAGGHALRSIIIAQQLLDTRDIAIFHHTGCGLTKFTTSEIVDTIKKNASPEKAAEVAQALEQFPDFQEFKDVEGSVKEDVEFLKGYALLLPDTKVMGWVHHVEDGRVRSSDACVFNSR
ncbi:carbonic anhydrase, partial [Rhodocollybia butyracea]